MAGGIKVKFSPRRAAIKRVQVETSAKTTEKAAQLTQRRVKENMRKKGRVRTGRMIDSVRIETLEVGTQTWRRVYSDADYTRYQEEGVREVHALRPGGRLRFMGRAGVFVFPRRTKGFRGGHFFRDAKQKITVNDFDTGE